MDGSKPAKFRFRIRIRGGWEMDNITVHGRDRTHAEAKLRRMYPWCEVLEGEACEFSSQMRHILNLHAVVDRRMAAVR